MASSEEGNKRLAAKLWELRQSKVEIKDYRQKFENWGSLFNGDNANVCSNSQIRDGFFSANEYHGKSDNDDNDTNDERERERFLDAGVWIVIGHAGL